MGPRVGDAAQEVEQLAVAVVDGVDRASGEEAVAQVAHGALDAPLLLGFAHAAKARLHMQRAGEVEQPGVKTNRVAVALEHDDLGVVEEPLPRRALEEDARPH